MSYLQRISVFTACVLTLLVPSVCLAQDVWTAQEIAITPRYCQTHPFLQLTDPNWARSLDKNETERWRTLIGAHPYEGLHHYCWGQMRTFRAHFLSKTKQERVHHLRGSIGEFDYVLRHTAGRPFVLTPEILLKKGENLIELERGAEASLTLQQAIQVKPDYWPPYAVLAEYFEKVGDIPKAREWLERGLAVAPDTKRLLALQSKLGGGSGRSGGAPAKTAPSSTPRAAASGTPAAEATEPEKPSDK